LGFAVHVTLKAAKPLKFSDLKVNRRTIPRVAPINSVPGGMAFARGPHRRIPDFSLNEDEKK
jgi:hypothetical protein